MLQLCRTCKNANSQCMSSWINIFSANSANKVQVHQIRSEMDIWNLNVMENDGLPHEICPECAEMFTNIYIFRQNCIAVQNSFKILYEQPDDCREEKVTPFVQVSCKTESKRIDAEAVNMDPLTVSNYNTSANQTNQTMGIHEKAHGCDDKAEILTTEDLLDQTLDRKLIASSASCPTLKLPSDCKQTRKSARTQGKTKENLALDKRRTKPTARESCQPETQPQLTCKYCISLENDAQLLFQTNEDLNAHFKQLHSSCKPYNCPHCSSIFKSKPKRQHHMTTAHFPESIPCPYCDKKFKIKSALEIHHRRNHMIEDRVCSVCGQEFQQISLFRFNYHMRWHNPKQQYKCELCDKVFVQSKHLINHENVHTGERPHLCSICGKDFANPMALLRHTRAHSGMKSLPCKYCDETFSTSQKKRQHLITAHADKPLRPETKAERRTREGTIQCDVCMKKMYSQFTLKQHMFLLHGQSPKNKESYSCTLCTRTFYMKYSLLKHMERH